MMASSEKETHVANNLPTHLPHSAGTARPTDACRHNDQQTFDTNMLSVHTLEQWSDHNVTHLRVSSSIRFMIPRLGRIDYATSRLRLAWF